MNRKLNYNQLYYFYVIASVGSIKDACEKLHLTQPTISGQLKALEEDLGYQLFDRKYRKLQLNHDGKTVYQKIAPVFIATESILNKENMAADQGEILRVGTTKTVARQSAISLLESHKNISKLRYRIHTDNQTEILEMLKADQVDLVISDSPLACAKSKLTSINLGKIPFYLVTNKNSEISHETCITEILNTIPFIHYTNEVSIFEEINMYFNINDVSPKVVVWCDDPGTILEVLKYREAIAILPESWLKGHDNKERGHIKVITEIQAIQVHIWAITSELTRQKSAIKNLLNSKLNYLM